MKKFRIAITTYQNGERTLVVVWAELKPEADLLVEYLRGLGIGVTCVEVSG